MNKHVRSDQQLLRKELTNMPSTVTGFDDGVKDAYLLQNNPLSESNSASIINVPTSNLLQRNIKELVPNDPLENPLIIDQ